jgi:S-DNA-T family DNA segregation ATPase FtsK/SpoIIIE
MPHLLVASETWWWKSSAITNILASLMKNRVQEAPIEFIIIDPKKVEFALYRGLWGFKVETNYEKALVIMAELCEEMDNRYEELMNKWVKELKTLHNRGENLDMRYKVLIIDEFADIMTDPKVKNEFEMYVKRLTALGRACWIHLILATQNPTVDIVTGLIKANIPARLWLRTSDSSKSRIILDSWELAQIKEKWEAYIKTASGIEHIKNFFISEEEIEKFIKEYKDMNLIMNWEEKQTQIQEKDKYDLLFEQMKTFKTFKISWYKEIENFTENNFRNMSKFFQEKWIIEKLIWNKIELKNEILLDENLKKELEKIL